MMSERTLLDPADLKLLREVIWRRRPELAPLLEHLGLTRLSDEQREEIRGILADEFSETGLQTSGDPNQHGLKLDDIIGRLMYY